MIIPIAQLIIDWDTFVSGTANILGRSPTRKLDQAGMPVGDHLSFIATIGGFLDPNADPYSFIRTNESALDHLYYTFLCETTILSAIRVHSNLKILATNETVFLLSGTLRQYKYSIVECSRESLDYELRFFFNYLFMLFKRQGLELIWSAYSKRLLSDGTIEFNL